MDRIQRQLATIDDIQFEIEQQQVEENEQFQKARYDEFQRLKQEALEEHRTKRLAFEKSQKRAREKQRKLQLVKVMNEIREGETGGNNKSQQLYKKKTKGVKKTRTGDPTAAKTKNSMRSTRPEHKSNANGQQKKADTANSFTNKDLKPDNDIKQKRPSSGSSSSSTPRADNKEAPVQQDPSARKSYALQGATKNLHSLSAFSSSALSNSNLVDRKMQKKKGFVDSLSSSSSSVPSNHKLSANKAAEKKKVFGDSLSSSSSSALKNDRNANKLQTGNWFHDSLSASSSSKKSNVDKPKPKKRTGKDSLSSSSASALSTSKSPQEKGIGDSLSSSSASAQSNTLSTNNEQFEFRHDELEQSEKSSSANDNAASNMQDISSSGNTNSDEFVTFHQTSDHESGKASAASSDDDKFVVNTGDDSETNDVVEESFLFRNDANSVSKNEESSESSEEFKFQQADGGSGDKDQSSSSSAFNKANTAGFHSDDSSSRDFFVSFDRDKDTASLQQSSDGFNFGNAQQDRYGDYSSSSTSKDSAAKKKAATLKADDVDSDSDASRERQKRGRQEALARRVALAKHNGKDEDQDSPMKKTSERTGILAKFGRRISQRISTLGGKGKNPPVSEHLEQTVEDDGRQKRQKDNVWDSSSSESDQSKDIEEEVPSSTPASMKEESGEFKVAETDDLNFDFGAFATDTDDFFHVDHDLGKFLVDEDDESESSST